nr:hypothetical protein [Candidatus Sigynarchaeota archaeon]
MATENAKFFYFLSKELTSDGFKFMHVSPKKFDRKLHSRDEIIITTGSEGPNLPELPDDVVILSYDDTQYPLSEKNVQNFYRMFRILMDSGIEECNRIDIGVDPGFKHTGLALFVNNTFVEATIIPTSDARIKDFLEMAI